MEKIELIAKILMALCALFVTPYLKGWLVTKVGEMKANEIVSTVETLCKSAQQLLWEKTGEERLEYVMENLSNLEIEINDEVRALIESKVYDLHQ